MHHSQNARNVALGQFQAVSVVWSMLSLSCPLHRILMLTIRLQYGNWYSSINTSTRPNRIGSPKGYVPRVYRVRFACTR